MLFETFWSFIDEKEYYERQIATLKSFEEVESFVARSQDYVIDEQILAEDRAERAAQEIAMQISNWANVFLLTLKVWLSVELLLFLSFDEDFLLSYFIYWFELSMMSICSSNVI